MMGSELTVSAQERDLGATLDNSVMTSAQCAPVVKKANKMLECIRNGMENDMKNVIMPWYKLVVLPHLDTVCSIGDPITRGYCRIRGGSEKNDKNDQGPGKSLAGEIEKIGIIGIVT